MEIKRINRSQFEEDFSSVTAKEKMLKNLMNHRLILLLSFVASLVGALILIYLTIARDSLEIGFLEKDKMDTPSILHKIRENSDPSKADRWVRGMERRFIAYFFTDPTDSEERVKEAAIWLEAHSEKGSALAQRSIIIHDEAQAYLMGIKEKSSMFYPTNDFDSLKIRKIDEYIVTERTGYLEVEKEGKISLNHATLKVVMQAVNVSGIKRELGGLNATGLEIIDARIEYIEDKVTGQKYSKSLLE